MTDRGTGHSPEERVSVMDETGIRALELWDAVNARDFEGYPPDLIAAELARIARDSEQSVIRKVLEILHEHAGSCSGMGPGCANTIDAKVRAAFPVEPVETEVKP